MTEAEILAIKKQLWDTCMQIQEKKAESSKEGMLAAQASANEQKGTMGDRWESFREQMQIDRDMYARQYDEALQVLDALRRIDPARIQDKASPGAIVVTDRGRFFISASLGHITLPDGEKYMAVSAASPLFRAMTGKGQGEKFSFRDMVYKVEEVW